MEDAEKITIKSYNQTVEEYSKNVEGLHPAKEAEKFLSYLGKKKLILDMGCGSGRDAKIFAEKCMDVIGVDFSEKMIAAAGERAEKAQFYVMDIRKLGFEDNHFDGIWANAVFLHLPKKDVLKGLQEAYRVLKEGGIIYLSVKEGQGEGLIADKRYRGAKKFWSFFRKEEIEDLANKASFHIVESYVDGKRSAYDTHPGVHLFCRKKDEKRRKRR